MSTLLPVYYQIKQTIKSRILNNDFKPGYKIPTENELAKQFNVSKMTVRQAIAQLSQEGFLVSKRGSGTFVTDNKEFIDSLSIESTGFMDEIFYQVQKAKTRFVEINEIAASNSICNKLGLSGDKVVQIKRIRFLDDSPFNYAINYIPVSIGSKIRKEQLYEKPLLETIEKDLKIPLTEAFQTMEASFSDQEVSKLLNIPAGSPMLFVERITYTSKGKPVLLSQLWYRGDLFKYIARFKNIKAKNKDFWVHHNEYIRKTSEKVR